MKFTTNTKPIVDGLELGIINENISKFYQKSCVVQLTVEDAGLRVNTEAPSIKSELLFKGKVEGDGTNQVFVDSKLFKDLMGTIDTNEVEFELLSDRLSVRSGKAEFRLPVVLSSADVELERPNEDSQNGSGFDIEQQNWKFIKDHQMYSIGISLNHPVYTYVWVSDDGKVIVGDYDNSIFTYSKNIDFNETCLIPSSIINLLTNVPENSVIVPIGRSYRIFVTADPFTYICEFTPKYEDDEGVGSYKANMILSFFDDTSNSFKIDSNKILKYINQADLFSSTDSIISVNVTDSTFNMKNENVDCTIPIDNPYGDFELNLQLGFFKNLIMHIDSDEINICPLKQGDECSGIIAWTDDISTVLGSVDN